MTDTEFFIGYGAVAVFCGLSWFFMRRLGKKKSPAPSRDYEIAAADVAYFKQVYSQQQDAAAAGPSKPQTREAKRWVIYKRYCFTVLAVYLVSVVYGLIFLPDGIKISSSQTPPTAGYMLMAGFFIILALLNGRYIAQIFPLMHLYIMWCNL